jgi:membrane-anchored mycosin MYCP
MKIGKGQRFGLCAVALTAMGLPLAAVPAAADTPQVAQQLASGQPCATSSGLQLGSGSSWPTLSTDLDDAWSLGRGASVMIALLDTGVAAGGVPRLAGHVTPGPRLAGPAGADCVGHGTFVAGLLAAQPNTEGGFSGVAPNSHVLSLSVTDASGNTTADRIAQGVDAAVAAHVRVIDVSVGTSADSANLRRAVTDAVAAGVVVIAPATLDGQQQNGAVYPAAYPDVLSVADIGSNGPGTQVTGAPVDVAAPGDGVVGAGIGGGAETASGASYATAFIAGTAALLDSYLGPTPPASLVQRLEHTAVHAGTTVPDPRVGFGVVDPYAALSTVDSSDSAAFAVTPARRVVVPPAPSRAATRTALTVAAAAIALSLIVGFVMLTVAALHSRRRHP